MRYFHYTNTNYEWFFKRVHSSTNLLPKFRKKFPFGHRHAFPTVIPTEAFAVNSKIMLTIYSSRFGNWSVWSQRHYAPRCSWNDIRKFRERNELCAAAGTSKPRWNWDWNEDATYWAQQGDEWRSDVQPSFALAEFFELSAESFFLVAVLALLPHSRTSGWHGTAQSWTDEV